MVDFVPKRQTKYYNFVQNICLTHLALYDGCGHLVPDRVLDPHDTDAGHVRDHIILAQRLEVWLCRGFVMDLETRL